MEMEMEMMMMRNYNSSSGGLGIIKSFMEETSYNNRVVLGSLMPEWMWGRLPHLAQTWLRNYTAATLNYFFSSLLSCLYIYLYNHHHHHRRRHNHHSSSSKYFHISNNNNNSTITTTTEAAAPPDVIPNKKAMAMQICVAMKAMPWYVFLPTLSEYMVENGWTRCFSRISEVGWVAYIWYFGLYFIVVEFGIYWVHRGLHDIKPLYKYLHATHHIYNKQDMISPFAGLAFHPLDGIMQAAPHVIALFIVPMHFKTHIVFLFLEEIWTANIHDCIHGQLWPVMGAGYHTIHHTTYRHNYGHYTLWMDWMFGTLRDPLDDKPKKI